MPRNVHYSSDCGEMMEAGIGFVVGMFFGGTVMCMILSANGDTYKDGQIDALTGNVKYELIVQPDSSRIWVEK